MAMISIISLTVSIFSIVHGHNFVPADIAKLSSEIDGEIINKNSSNYASAIEPFDFELIKYPDFVFECTSPNDVQKVLQFLLEFEEEFVVRSGRHSMSGYSTCNGSCSILDVGKIDTLSIDEEEETATVGPGIHANEFAALLENDENEKQWWVTLGMDDPGMGGHVHGGGWGIGVRKYGLVIDNVLEATVVTYKQNKNGKYITNIKTASNDENSDLFFCVRGVGGPSCGVVVEYKIKIYEQRDNFLFAENQFIVNSNSMQTVLDLQQIVIDHGFSDEIGLEYWIHFHIIGNPINGEPIFLGLLKGVWYDFDNMDKGRSVLNETILKLNLDDGDNNYNGSIISIHSFLGETSWKQMRCYYSQGTTAYGIQNCPLWDNDFTLDPRLTPGYSGAQPGFLGTTQETYNDWVTNGAFEYMFQQITTKCPAVTDFSVISFCGWFITSWGGQLKNIAVDSNGFAHRDAAFEIEVLSIYHEDLDDEWSQQTRSTVEDIYDFWLEQDLIEKRVYVNYINYQIPDDEYLDFYYAENQDKIKEIKCKWDPQNHLTNPQGVLQSSDECDEFNVDADAVGANNNINGITQNLFIVLGVLCGVILFALIMYIIYKRREKMKMAQDDIVMTQKGLEIDVKIDDGDAVKDENANHKTANADSTVF